MKVLAISTFNVDGLALYGRRMMATYREHWPTGIPLRVYAEGFSGEVDLLSASPWLAAFKARHAGRRFRDYRWDAVRFSHKVAAVCHAAQEDFDALIWMDGDVVTHSHVQMKDVEGWLPGEAWISWLDRKSVYPECGFFILNCRHSRHGEMIERLEAMYAEDGLFSLPEWHDSFVLQHVVKSSGIEAKSLSGAGSDTHHPLVNGPLGEWFDHLKGKRKQIGRSPKVDLRVRREEAYWQ